MSAITRIQGMQDLLPEDWQYWSHVMKTATETAQTFGFEQISVPVMEKHDLFVREGTTLATRIPISFTTAALGGSVDIPDLDGGSNTLDIPAGIQSGKQLRVRGAGMPVLQGRGRGDLVVEIAVETPTKLSKAQKELLKQFQETETGEECPESRGFFDKLKDAFAS